MREYRLLRAVDEEIIPLLRQLYFHHSSQAKPGSGPVSARYHKELAQKLEKAGITLKNLIGD